MVETLVGASDDEPIRVNLTVDQLERIDRRIPPAGLVLNRLLSGEDPNMVFRSPSAETE